MINSPQFSQQIPDCLQSIQDLKGTVFNNLYMQSWTESALRPAANGLVPQEGLITNTFWPVTTQMCTFLPAGGRKSPPPPPPTVSPDQKFNIVKYWKKFKMENNQVLVKSKNYKILKSVIKQLREITSVSNSLKWGFYKVILPKSEPTLQ